MHQAPVCKDDWLGGGGRRRGGPVLPERSEEKREAGLKQEEEKQDGTTAPRPEAERAGGPGTPRHQAATENPPAEKTVAANPAENPAAEPPVAADPVPDPQPAPEVPLVPAEIVRVLPPPAAAAGPEPLAAAATLKAWDDPEEPRERRRLHPLPRGLVELYGVLAVLLVLVPEWLADTLLERANISRGNPLMPFSVAWRRDPELLMGRMTLWQLRTLAQRLGLRHYARNHREQLVNRLLHRMARMDAPGLDALAQSLKQR